MGLGMRLLSIQIPPPPPGPPSIIIEVYCTTVVNYSALKLQFSILGVMQISVYIP